MALDLNPEYPVSTTNSGAVYLVYPTGPAQSVAYGAFERPGGGADPTFGPRPCFPVAGTQRLVPVDIINLSTLGFVPPFHMQ
jgi:hypothetical protein